MKRSSVSRAKSVALAGGVALISSGSVVIYYAHEQIENRSFGFFTSSIIITYDREVITFYQHIFWIASMLVAIGIASVVVASLFFDGIGRMENLRNTYRILRSDILKTAVEFLVLASGSVVLVQGLVTHFNSEYFPCPLPSCILLYAPNGEVSISFGIVLLTLGLLITAYVRNKGEISSEIREPIHRMEARPTL